MRRLASLPYQEEVESEDTGALARLGNDLPASIASSAVRSPNPHGGIVGCVRRQRCVQSGPYRI